MAPQSTLDHSELARFNRLASTWWDESGPMWPLHQLNQFRVQVILNVLHERNIIDRNKEHPLQGLKVLDVGCGGGILSESLCKLGAQVTGIDLAKNSIAIARQHANNQGLDIAYLCEELDTLEDEFDIVFNMEVVEHVSHLKHFMLRCNEKVAQGGMMFVSTINRSILSFLMAIVGAEYLLRLLPRGTHNWQKFVTPDELKVLLKKSSLNTTWISGVSLNPFTKRYKLTKSCAVNYMLLATSDE
ncbi:bifunctional 2-polyprenyl-6-hydroxyphenol methylase/3-demethylubiquinol 3-O-methyltransferase UbiG [Ketobacter sp. MCCC 1A13808]|uniref:bifunctional 2-polyprenyl-6-hydroxyphenol methylase/3-demethylubiquinol 3-O-methyltransferase UbiG n=1 Tax=Ketobacter sp. MCCC 1A13808 TaxID=2602738 RepID=UPI000F0DE40B|nr:bifunctional 2-polyprenyl-6-hydroxyphenol methylase/3-demethylubiquinol 3-O-methyltransferase UbiG [Ketobacter sp. MCCC 1A13808]MVF10566.1 bifunctional 2-polyprenyl-6-hydroxyphenol methylase/3-demethylubiquinol 3-O-methyltransferase UbiG [Ketobacter sp. MCCC 1A13808]RLP55993.1 MAG: bifunctional 2-polyprenyl-6-hydroxyphenol methylase/3-demethylubiquinol 3-O-methyltransferase UbiG [Ketobacter sp.]